MGMAKRWLTSCPELAADLTDLGVNVLFVEYRGYGASSGEPGLARLLDDVPVIVQALPVPPNQLVAFGRSLGSLYAIDLVNRFPGDRRPYYRKRHRRSLGAHPAPSST